MQRSHGKRTLGSKTLPLVYLNRPRLRRFGEKSELRFPAAVAGPSER